MNLLASSIPGIRELRAPLVAGYTWLLFAWLIVQPKTPLADHTAGAVGSVVDLANAAGPVATAAAVSVGAYLLGTVSAVALSTAHLSWSGLYGRAARRGPHSLRRVLARAWKAAGNIASQPAADQGVAAAQTGLRRKGVRDLRTFSLAHLRVEFIGLPVQTTELRALTDRLLKVGHQLSLRDVNGLLEVVSAFQRDLDREFQLPQTLLVGDKPEIFAQGDRVRAEAEFRLAMVLPLTAVIIALACVASAIWLAALVGPAALFYAGRTKDREARDFSRNAVSYDKVPSPTLDRFIAHTNGVIALGTSEATVLQGAKESMALADDHLHRVAAALQAGVEADVEADQANTGTIAERVRSTWRTWDDRARELDHLSLVEQRLAAKFGPVLITEIVDSAADLFVRTVTEINQAPDASEEEASHALARIEGYILNFVDIREAFQAEVEQQPLAPQT